MAFLKLDRKAACFERCKAAHETALKRSLIEAAQHQYKSLQHDADPVAVPPQPSDRDRSLHELTHTPYQPWCKFCVMSRAKANHHSHIPDPEGVHSVSTRQFSVIPFSWSLAKKVQL